MEEYNSILATKIQIHSGRKLRNDMIYELVFNKTKKYESVKIDGVLELHKANQKTLSSTKLRLVNFKSYYGVEEINYLNKRSFKIIDLEENCTVGKGVVTSMNDIIK
ncbi:hypothetical protein [Tenacibaculum amylolyticum]|uniref:hypothetical protein n=1 Tax=Tenacibaculum amylolyticum TaxID=104269 RepID=UPI0038B6414A